MFQGNNWSISVDGVVCNMCQPLAQVGFWIPVKHRHYTHPMREDVKKKRGEQTAQTCANACFRQLPDADTISALLLADFRPLLGNRFHNGAIQFGVSSYGKLIRLDRILLGQSVFTLPIQHFGQTE
jgi:hypothetical protein